ncbi:hypothetical protein [Marivita hallyeonensis]|uniref:Uncharacterized protein n=1 Tax=Marivita hallyeonensis TaxID=996342 RepID=A0A1M5NPB6_9RHOB|nr:hypothetical protein [Marivita hallyeonensis]SHG91396.1 hypothetical protein SAMN05443551_1000 [Marivita hallyeonensis]
MTALKEFQRLEAAGVWRATPADQRKDVIVSLGDASLTILDLRENVLAHWSIAAVARANKGQRPAIYHPDGDPGETLELDDNGVEMIDAIEQLRTAIDRTRPKPGKLRLWITGALGAAVIAGIVFWLPDALLRHTVQVVPAVKRAEIGDALLSRITRISGQACMTRDAREPLRRLSSRVLGPGQRGALVVLPAGVRTTAHLPGGRILLNKALVEDPEEPDVTAGYILTERLRALTQDPLEEMLIETGLWSSLRLLTTGELRDTDLERYSEYLLSKEPMPLSDDVVLAAFETAELRSTPYAYAVDITGETTLPLIEADPMTGRDPRPVLSDADWLRLQGICGE